MSIDFFIPEFTQSITINNKSYTCMSSKLTKEQIFSGYGLDEGVKFWVSLKIADLPQAPQLYEGVDVTFRNKTYTIKIIEEDSAYIMVKFGLVSTSS